MNVLNREYDTQAAKFLEKMGATFEARFLYSGPFFDDDKENRDIYEITIKQTPKSGAKPKEWKLKFGQSILFSREYVEKSANQRYDRGEPWGAIMQYKRNAVKVPTAYDVLAAITKNDPGTFTDFCAEMGYDTDSRKAEKIYFSVQEEYKNVLRMFGPWIEELQAIQ